MARPWVKLHATILDDDAFVFEIPRQHVGTWALMLALAGRVDDGGRLGRREVVASRLGLSDGDMTATLRELGGRVAEQDGELWIRDWEQWQPPTTSTERSRAHRAATAQQSGDENATLQQRSPSARARRASSSLSSVSDSAVEEGGSGGKPQFGTTPLLAAAGARSEQPHLELVAALEEALGYPVDSGEEAPAAHWLERRGYSATDVTRTVAWLRETPDGFWSDKPITMATVKRRIGAAKAADFKHRQASKNGRKPMTAEDWKR